MAKKATQIIINLSDGESSIFNADRQVNATFIQRREGAADDGDPENYEIVGRHNIGFIDPAATSDIETFLAHVESFQDCEDCGGCTVAPPRGAQVLFTDDTIFVVGDAVTVRPEGGCVLWFDNAEGRNIGVFSLASIKGVTFFG